jgi:putative glycosyltransferase (TIGR04372 family)
MGSVVSSPLPAGLDQKIIDYAAINRSAFGDIFLLAHCKFLVSGGAGLFWVSAAFNRPVVMTDAGPVGWRPPGPRDLFIPPKLWIEADKRYMTFTESIRVAQRYISKTVCEQDGIQMVLASPEEIAAITIEMNQRLDGRWVGEAEDEELQRRFNMSYGPNDYGYEVPCRIGAEYLRSYSYLLD